ncbi:MAG: glycosyl hydrolase [Planctomycetota bacterium]
MLHALVLALSAALPPTAAQEGAAPAPAEVLTELEFREVGPYRGGRAATVTGVADEEETYYMGAAGGGVWKTTDGGDSWDNVSSGFFGGSMGAVAVAPSDSSVVYAGGGEKTVRGNVGHGDGAWRSDDAGRTWRQIGLEDSHHISRIRIHPDDPDVAWAAVMGHLYGPHPTRGVYRTTDGGETWERVQFVDDNVGCVDLALDPNDADVLYATFWRVRRTPWSLSSGGEGSSIWKSTDGGDSWTDVSGNEGMPEGPLGIAGITVSPADSDVVYAIVEAKEGGVFRSSDAGDTWERVNTSRSLRQRAWYYSRIQADPLDADRVYVMNVGFHRSDDGGKNFKRLSTPHSDNHDLWIAPDDPDRMIEGNDGGANVSTDGGATWSTQANQPTSQMYRVSTDDAFPYRLLGGQQDNSAIRIDSANLRGSSITRDSFESTAGGESGWLAAHPSDPDIVFGGSYGGYLTMVDHGRGQFRNVTVWPDNPLGYGAEGMRYRFQWNFPLYFSPHGDTAAPLDSEDSFALYAASNVLFRSTDLGASWTQISPDLTRNDPTKLGPSGGPITKDNTGVEYYCTIFASFESPLEKGVIWCGSDDGRVHVTRDDGATWTEITPPSLPEWTQINDLVPDPFEAGGAYLAGTRYKLDDFRPYVFHTTDYGATWTDLSAGLPQDEFTRAIEPDTERPGLLFVGTERGLHASLDGGATWAPFQNGLPTVPVTDLAMKDDDLVVATQGRGYWILDRLAPLRQMDASHVGQSVLYAPEPASRAMGRRNAEPSGAGTNPRFGAVFDYLLAEDAEDVSLEILDANGEVLRRFVPEGEAEKNEHLSRKDDVLPVEPGHNRFAWNLRTSGAESFPKMILWNGSLGAPRVPPGEYEAVLRIGEGEARVPFTVEGDPRSLATDEDLVAQYEFASRTGETLTRAHRAIRDLRAVRKDLKDVRSRMEGMEGDERDALDASIDAALETMKGVEETLYQTKNQSRQDPLNFPIRLTDKLAGVRGGAMRGEFGPTAQMRMVADELSAAIEAELVKLEPVFTEAVPAIDRAARALEVPLVRVPKR